MTRPRARKTAAGRKKKKTAGADTLTPVPEQFYWARRPFTYDGRELDRGVVIKLTGAKNDEKLLRLGYLAEVDPKAGLSECGRCGAWFHDMSMRDGHGKLRHGPVGRGPRVVNLEDLSPAQQAALLADVDQYETERPGFMGDPSDQEVEAGERYLQEVAPLFLDKSAASRA